VYNIREGEKRFFLSRASIVQAQEEMKECKKNRPKVREEWRGESEKQFEE